MSILWHLHRLSTGHYPSCSISGDLHDEHDRHGVRDVHGVLGGGHRGGDDDARQPVRDDAVRDDAGGGDAHQPVHDDAVRDDAGDEGEDDARHDVQAVQRMHREVGVSCSNVFEVFSRTRRHRV